MMAHRRLDMKEHWSEDPMKTNPYDKQALRRDLFLNLYRRLTEVQGYSKVQIV